ncbi:hypothetical protein D3C78_1837550 [compost metagenome]
MCRLSPSRNMKRRPSTRTVCGRVLTRCISMRDSASLKKAWWRKRDGSRSVCSSRRMRCSRFRLKAAVTPALSL